MGKFREGTIHGKFVVSIDGYHSHKRAIFNSERIIINDELSIRKDDDGYYISFNNHYKEMYIKGQASNCFYLYLKDRKW